MIIDDLNKQPVPTVPDDTNDPPRFAQPIETTKDAFTLELRKFFNHSLQSASFIEEIPTIKKYDLTFNSNESSLETAVNLIQKHPDIPEHLPLIAILGATGRNKPMSINNQFVGAVAVRPTVTGSIAGPFSLADGQTLQFQTTDLQGSVNATTILFRASRFQDITHATADEVVSEIKFQSLYASAANDGGHIDLTFAGPLSGNVNGTIKVIGGTAMAALGFTLNQQATYTTTVPSNRYIQSAYIEIAMEIATEDENSRTELTDLLWSFFTFYIADRQSTLFGRSIFDNSVAEETYQIVIKTDPSIAGEAEVPRPNTQLDKIYVNRITVPVLTMQYTDRAVVVPGTTTPYYLDASNVSEDDTIPFKS